MNKEMRVVRLDDLKPYKNNPRKNDMAVPYVQESIQQVGYLSPIIVDENLEILAGHTRYKALRGLDREEAEVIVVTGLTEKQKKKYRILDNKVGEFASWDFETLELELQDLDFTGFDFGFDIDQIEPEVAEDDYEPEDIETRCKLGDLWQLGDHRLICGDSTDVNVFDKLLNGDKADVCVTSPPYNASHMDVNLSPEHGGGVQKGTQKKYINDDDKRSDEEYFEFLCGNIDALLMYADEIFYNIGVASGSKKTIAEILHRYQDQFKELMYWEKENPMPVIVESVISSSVELIICFGANGTRSFNRFKDRMFHGVIKGLSASTTNKYADVHKATFPVYLPSEIITRFTEPKGTVLDCFGGTGTTLIACEQLDRRCFMVELEPCYCDIIIDRWEQFTGKKAVLLNE